MVLRAVIFLLPTLCRGNEVAFPSVRSGHWASLYPTHMFSMPLGETAFQPGMMLQPGVGLSSGMAPTVLQPGGLMMQTAGVHSIPMGAAVNSIPMGAAVQTIPMGAAVQTIPMGAAVQSIPLGTATNSAVASMPQSSGGTGADDSPSAGSQSDQGGEKPAVMAGAIAPSAVLASPGAILPSSGMVMQAPAAVVPQPMLMQQPNLLQEENTLQLEDLSPETLFPSLFGRKRHGFRG